MTNHKFIFTYWNPQTENFVLMTAQTDSPENVRSKLLDRGYDFVEYACIDIYTAGMTLYKYELQDSTIEVLDDDIMIAEIRSGDEHNIVVTFDGTVCKFRDLQQAVTFAAIYNYPPIIY